MKLAVSEIILTFALKYVTIFVVIDVDKVLDKVISIGTEVGLKLIILIFILLIGLKLIKVLCNMLKKSIFMNKLDKTVHNILINIINIGLKILLFISLAAYIGIPMTSVITLIGSAGLALGLALQGGLANLAGGIIILIFKEISVGDYIESNGVGGTVEDINVFYTTLVSPDNKSITIPNGDLANGTIINYSRCDSRRLDISVSVAYNSDIEKVKKVLLKLCEANEMILKDRDIFVRLTSMAESSLIFTIRVWVKPENYWNLNFDLQESIKATLDKNNIEIPYPQMDVHINSH